MRGWLASVTGVAEARMVLAAGASIVDCKNPGTGALGALPVATVAAVVREVAGRVPVSATVGDFPAMDPEAVAGAVAEMAGSGVDYVKIGLFPAPRLAACLEALAGWAGRRPLVAVLFADRAPDFSLLPRLAGLGFAGAMLDTVGKVQGTGNGGLLAHQTPAALGDFVARARDLGLLTGLAGSLGLADIDRLRPLAPDYLGFRGALCRGRARAAELDPAALAAVAERMAGGALGVPLPGQGDGAAASLTPFVG